jgi:hypothetical protein
MVDQPQERRYEPDRGPEYEPEYAPPGPRYQSGAVTGVAIYNFVLAAFQVIIALLLVIGASWLMAMFGAAASATGDDKAKEGAAAASGLFAGIIGVFVVCFLIIGVLLLLAGIGVLNRRQWGRILTLVLAALAGIGALLSLFSIGVNPIWSIVEVLIFGGYCVYSYVVLLNSTYAREFATR